MKRYQKLLFNFIVLITAGLLLGGCTINKTKTTETKNNNKDVDIIINGKTNNGDSNKSNTQNQSKDIEQKDLPNKEEVSNQSNSGTGNNNTIPNNKFSTSKQVLGENSTTQVIIASYQKFPEDQYYKITFKLTPTDSKNTDEPKVIAQYINIGGIIRVVFKNVKKDTTGLAYQTADIINKDGIVKIYHNISADQTEELYDIGVTKETPFYLTANQKDSLWEVQLYIKYPGNPSTNNNLDLGSSDFSTAHQVITGAHKEDGAQIYSYSYSTQNGVLRFVWNVAGSQAKPIPAVEAANTPTGLIEVEFPSLVNDVIAKHPGTLTLPGGITLNYKKENDTSIYKFKVNEEREFKLHASTNPNQVILEIKL